MRNPRRRLGGAQLELFCPPRPAPAWEALPAPAQEQAVRVLARLLGEVLGYAEVPAPGGEVCDE